MCHQQSGRLIVVPTIAYDSFIHLGSMPWKHFVNNSLSSNHDASLFPLTLARETLTKWKD
jgi:hypothetical protein